jgi:ribonuclease VapC
MILDTSALAAIFFGEPELELFIQAIHDAGTCRIGAANFVELATVEQAPLAWQAAAVTA